MILAWLGEPDRALSQLFIHSSIVALCVKITSDYSGQ
jgi:hypothetical protein